MGSSGLANSLVFSNSPFLPPSLARRWYLSAANGREHIIQIHILCLHSSSSYHHSVKKEFARQALGCKYLVCGDSFQRICRKWQHAVRALSNAIGRRGDRKSACAQCVCDRSLLARWTICDAVVRGLQCFCQFSGEFVLASLAASSLHTLGMIFAHTTRRLQSVRAEFEVPLTKSLFARWTCDALVRGCFCQNARAAIIARKSEAPAKRSLHLPTQTQSSTLPSTHHRALVVPIRRDGCPRLGGCPRRHPREHFHNEGYVGNALLGRRKGICTHRGIAQKAQRVSEHMEYAGRLSILRSVRELRSHRARSLEEGL